MNGAMSSTPWIPYKIPATPTPISTDKYLLGVKYDDNPDKNATPLKNPSQFLEWQRMEDKEFDVCENGEPKTYKLLTVIE